MVPRPGTLKAVQQERPTTLGMSFVSYVLAAGFVLACGVVAVVAIERIATGSLADADPRGRWARWSFTPTELGGYSRSKLFLVSVGGLFLELLLIRWLSSEIRILAYFKNLTLIACYLGFGLGCYLARRRINLLATLASLLVLAVLVKLPWPELRTIMAKVPSLVGALSGVDVWGVPRLPLVWSSVPAVLAAVGATVPLFALTALAFVSIGQLVGWYIENAADGIGAYSINVVGSLVGILAYSALCFLTQPPWVWWLVSGALLMMLFVRRWGLGLAIGATFAICAGLAALVPGHRALVYWSPYQKLTLTPRKEGSETIAYMLNTNDSWYQQIINLSPAFVAAHPGLFGGDSLEWNPYNLPYRYYPDPPSVLVLGAGMGNDVAAALRHGAGEVVAVEIDPLIVELGRRFHFERPYSSERVRLVVDDARSYVENTDDRFDLVLFSLLDSHTTSSHFTNIRIDNYVYTKEALRAARRLLKPGGLFIVKFQVSQRWIAGRLRGLLRASFDQEPVQLEGEGTTWGTATGGRFFINGYGERFARVVADPALTAHGGRRGNVRTQGPTLTTDDWPYFYQHEPGLPASVILVSAVLALLGWRLTRATLSSGRPIRWHFFWLGAGFLLLEVQIVSRTALLFGTTWVVNSIVIAALLALILAANAVVAARPALPGSVAYAGLFVSIAVAYAVPIRALVVDPLLLRVLLAIAVLCLPVFFAGLVFIRSFAAERFGSEALGSNLLGALVGGLLESLSLWTGIRSLLVLAAILYASAWLARPRVAPDLVAAR
jgi:SAM-dependent methyltransferase